MTMIMVHGPWLHLTIFSHFTYDFEQISSKTSKKMRGKAWMSPGSWSVSAQGIWNNGTQIFWWILPHIRFQVVDCDPSLSNCWVREADVSMISSCAKTKVNFKVDGHSPADTFIYIYMATFCILFCNHPKINWNTYLCFTLLHFAIKSVIETRLFGVHCKIYLIQSNFAWKVVQVCSVTNSHFFRFFLVSSCLDFELLFLWLCLEITNHSFPFVTQWISSSL